MSLYDPNLDYYLILGVKREATPKDIKKAYEAKTVKTTEIEEAYEVLNNSDKRKAYDLWTEAPIKDTVSKTPVEAVTSLQKQTAPASKTADATPSITENLVEKLKGLWNTITGIDLKVLAYWVPVSVLISLFILEVITIWGFIVGIIVVIILSTLIIIMVGIIYRIVRWIAPFLLRPLSIVNSRAVRLILFFVPLVLIGLSIASKGQVKQISQAIEQIKTQQVLSGLCATAEKNTLIEGNIIVFSSKDLPDGNVWAYFHLNGTSDNDIRYIGKGGRLNAKEKIETLRLDYVKSQMTQPTSPLGGSDGEIVQCGKDIDIEAAKERFKQNN